MKRIWTSEEKACKQIADVVSDLRLDAHQVGIYLGESQPVEILNRIVSMLDGMYESRERFRRRLGEEASDIPALPLVDEISLNDTNTSFVTRCNILAELWLNFKNDDSYKDFFDINDLGGTLAFAFSNEYFSLTEKIKDIINETWDNFMILEGIEDTGFDSLADIWAYTNEN